MARTNVAFTVSVQWFWILIYWLWSVDSINSTASSRQNLTLIIFPDDVSTDIWVSLQLADESRQCNCRIFLSLRTLVEIDYNILGETVVVVKPRWLLYFYNSTNLKSSFFCIVIRWNAISNKNSKRTNCTNRCFRAVPRSADERDAVYRSNTLVPGLFFIGISLRTPMWGYTDINYN